jgi:hypothetical protein
MNNDPQQLDVATLMRTFNEPLKHLTQQQQQPLSSVPTHSSSPPLDEQFNQQLLLSLGLDTVGLQRQINDLMGDANDVHDFVENILTRPSTAPPSSFNSTSSSLYSSFPPSHSHHQHSSSSSSSRTLDDILGGYLPSSAPLNGPLPETESLSPLSAVSGFSSSLLPESTYPSASSSSVSASSASSSSSSSASSSTLDSKYNDNNPTTLQPLFASTSSKSLSASVSNTSLDLTSFAHQEEVLDLESTAPSPNSQGTSNASSHNGDTEQLQDNDDLELEAEDSR